MLFNKNKARKVNDKKVLKKVKKQWVTVSVATLAFLGAAGVSTISSNSVVAHADVKSTVESTETDGNHGSTETDGNHGSTE
ncbi:hypothetical protein, partial [Apilactobacillus xinyiensis]|uniref:hypothetical protein n=1 Tax=Apilactobacillus xinyiensis TaxID=2841032 RepID=UPI00200E82AE